MFYKDLFGARLRKLRRGKKEVQQDIANLLGVSTAQVSAMENGSKTTTVEKLALLCEHFNVSADYLLGLTDDPVPHNRKEPPHAP